MKKLFLYITIIIILVTSISLTYTQNNKVNDNFPQNFNEAEAWFDELHQPIEISTTNDTIN